MTEFKGDKRTKAYKEWKAKFDQEQESKPKGLGDTVAKITEATGIKKAVEFIAGDDCGCDERQEKLNSMFGYRKTECLTEDEYNFLTDFYARHKGSYLGNLDKRELVTIHNRVLHTNYNKGTSCTKCVKKVFTNLKKLIENY